MQTKIAGFSLHSSEAFIGGVFDLINLSIPILYSGVSFWTEIFSIVEYGATFSTTGGGSTQPHALGSAGIEATIPLNTYPSLILKLAIDCSKASCFSSSLGEYTTVVMYLLRMRCFCS